MLRNTYGSISVVKSTMSDIVRVSLFHKDTLINYYFGAGIAQ